MNHKKIQKKLILFLDKELPEREMKEVKQHLTQCRSCSKTVEQIEHLFKLEDNSKELEHFSLLWEKILQKINENKSPVFFTAFFFKQFIVVRDLSRIFLRHKCRTIVILVTLLAGLFLGVYLGNISTINDLKDENSKFIKLEQDKFYYSVYLDSFDDLPPESIGGAYMILAKKN